MAELDDIRSELDEIRDRVVMLENQMLSKDLDVMTARTVAREAERNVSGFRAEVRGCFTKVNADLAHISALLTSSLGKPDAASR